MDHNIAVLYGVVLEAPPMLVEMTSRLTCIPRFVSRGVAFSHRATPLLAYNIRFARDNTRTYTSYSNATLPVKLFLPVQI